MHILQTHTHLAPGIEANMVTQLAKYDNEYFLGKYLVARCCSRNGRDSLEPLCVSRSSFNEGEVGVMKAYLLLADLVSSFIRGSNRDPVFLNKSSSGSTDTRSFSAEPRRVRGKGGDGSGGGSDDGGGVVACCLIEFGKVEIRVERFNGSPLPPIYPEGREQREWRENRKSRQDGRFIHVVVISSDFPPVLFVRHWAGNEHSGRERGVQAHLLWWIKIGVYTKRLVKGHQLVPHKTYTKHGRPPAYLAYVACLYSDKVKVQSPCV
ncbi:hypothetical protein ALC57_01731 [Trachymyrmex cornetzi]|uniref:Uncharacterized protein n=1 Tax=Trachymyrmex cornetzi TaxID=471704 RepID=A0A195EKK1_9HYME|nr:hypothetical protein ALC57_01731 [Trachymyrmex cornetzi]